MERRTDLAIEAKRLWDSSMNKKSELSGVIARQSGHCGIPIDIVEIINDVGSKSLHKPIGTYVTVEVAAITQKEQSYFRNASEAVARVLRTMMAPCSSVLVVGLGNRDITPDALGPISVSNLVITRHFMTGDVCRLRGLKCVSGIIPGVLGMTGIESLDIVRGAVQTVQPDALIAVDALASCEPNRLCCTIQISDTGIVPGSGVGNHRHAFTKEELGVPVYAIGVPTVVDAKGILETSGTAPDLILTPRNIDFLVRDMAKLIGYGINLALQPTLNFDDIPGLLQ